MEQMFFIFSSQAFTSALKMLTPWEQKSKLLEKWVNQYGSINEADHATQNHLGRVVVFLRPKH